ncbi:hypothetical protein CERZMDRAFT_93410 [Cercospora zeae-maydis SCOH1-5]|uniref:Uncharacterized protein n=1 Tax=Cercospora zeae-maydis SCOH1-5 TaxID=717836 RepID=A0A6A6FVA0_9PEZI|nr:hypothetical protein CERZMDRAFT_93410 [Cercospora zeae-maydis SCOH1-5]
MGPSWQIEERRDNLWMHTQTDLNNVQIHDIMGRIYGEVWRSSESRRKYAVKDIRDDIASRWKVGHRHAHFRTIDPESGIYDAIETAARNATRIRVTAAAAQTGGTNWLRENDRGVLESPNVPIMFNLRAVPYVRNPNTFDAAFARASGDRASATERMGAQSASATPSAGGADQPRTARKRKASATPLPLPTARSTPTATDGSTDAGSDDELEDKAGSHGWKWLVGEDAELFYEPFVDDELADWPSEHTGPR